ncbi:hypothetical protein [Halosimplex amylolyticum]|uniref:hypothetical protein n=1 Tax=Halosimplex amylolyticum TaxID=3396616 RepID=UPI003F576DFC
MARRASDFRARIAAAVASRGTLPAHAAGVALFALVYGFVVRGLAVGQLYAFGDFAPFYGARAFEKFTSTWHAGGLGFPYVYNVLPAYIGAITAAGGALAQNAFYLALVPAGFLTFSVFVGRFVDSLLARYLAAGVYAINPVTVGEFVNGGIAALIGFAGLPLVLHYLWRVVERDDSLDALKAGMAFGATTVTPWLGFWMVGPFATYLAVRARRSPWTLARLVAAGVVGVVLALPNVHHVLQRLGGIDTGRDVLVRTLRWNYAYADPLTVARLAGNRGMLALNQLGYNTEPAMAVGLVVPAVGLLAWRRRELHVFYAVAASVVAFVVLTAAGATYGLFEAVPLFLTVRNPVKLQYPLLISLSVLFAAGTETALADDRVRTDASALSFGAARRHRTDGGRDRLRRVVILGLLVLALGSYAMPAAGGFGLEQVRGDDYAVDAGYERVADDLDGRALWLPYGYTTQLHLRHAYPNHVGIRSGGSLHGIPNNDYVSDLFRDAAAGRPIHDRLDDLGVQYVVVESDPPADYGEGSPRVVRRWGTPWLTGDPDVFAQRLRASDAYERVERRGEFTVFRVANVTERDRAVEREGLHVVRPPTNRSVETVGDNEISNPGFDDGTADWWLPPNVTGRTARLADESGGNDGGAVALSVDDSADRLPLAQAVSVREGRPYRLSVEATGSGTVRVVHFDGAPSPENRTGDRVLSVDEAPTTVAARGDTLAIRVFPNASSEVVVERVTLRRTTYPPATGAGAADSVPGVAVVDPAEAPPNATVVAANLNASAAERVGADVRVIDAETLVAGPLVFDDTYRQGVAVRLDREERPANVPDDARAVTHDTAEGRVVDYWVAGAFDETPVTVVRTSYHEGWTGPADAEHFRAHGWANGFTDAEPGEITWSGGDVRSLVVRAWAGAWLLALAALALVDGYRRAERWRDDGGTHALQPQ